MLYNASMKKIDYKDITFLITTVEKTFEQIFELVKSNNLKGNVMVGCQKSDKDFVENYFSEELKLSVFFQTSAGTSINRNFLLERVGTKFCFFFDDDIKFLDIELETINEFVSKNDGFDLVFFDYKYDDLIKKKVRWSLQKKLKWYKMRSFGTNSVLYRVEFLKREKLRFNENLGPGCYISSGEDGKFLMDAVKKTNKAFSFKSEIIEILTLRNSTWFTGYNDSYFRNIGYSYRMSYGILAIPSIVFTLVKHRKSYLKEHNFRTAFQYAMNGYNYYGKQK